MSTTHTTRITFLLGSGASIPAGMPSTANITERVLTDEDMFRHTRGVYCFGTESTLSPFPDEYVPRVRFFLNILKSKIEPYYEDQLMRPINYEDLFYVVKQVHDNESRNHDNPIIKTFIDNILPDIKELFNTHEYEINWFSHAYCMLT